MHIPHRDLLALFVMGIVIVALSLFSSSQPHSLASTDQDALDFKNLSSEYDDAWTQGVWHGQQVSSARVEDEKIPQVLGATDEIKRIEVDLSSQRLYAFEGGRKVYDFLISSGKWGRTPTGTFHIWSKFRYSKMSGGKKELGTYYYLPNVPFVMFFSNDEVPGSKGFSLHGTYWHSNFGHPMSHGCVNMKTEEAEVIYNWSLPATDGKKPARASDDNPGTEIVIYGEAPRE